MDAASWLTTREKTRPTANASELVPLSTPIAVVSATTYRNTHHDFMLCLWRRAWRVCIAHLTKHELQVLSTHFCMTDCAQFRFKLLRALLRCTALFLFLRRDVGSAHAARVGGGHAPGADQASGVPSALAVPVGEHLEHLRYHKRRHRRDARPAQHTDHYFLTRCFCQEAKMRQQTSCR